MVERTVRRFVGASARKDDAGAASLLTVAFVLVGIGAASLGASFLISSATKMGEDSRAFADERTGGSDPATMQVLEIRARVDAPGLEIRELLGVPAWSGPVDLRSVRIVLEIRGTSHTFTFSQEAGPGIFVASALRDNDGSTSQEPPVANAGDLVEIHLRVPEGIYVPGRAVEIQQTLHVGDSVAVRQTVRVPAALPSGSIARITGLEPVPEDGPGEQDHGSRETWVPVASRPAFIS